jgi:GAF domain-containing protein
MRRGARPAEAKVDAELAAVRKSLRNEASKRRALERRLAESLERKNATSAILEEKDRALTEALEQQTATSEILKALSTSPTDVRPVFDMIAEQAVKLCGAELSVVTMLRGDHLELAAVHGLTSEGIEATRGAFPMPLDADSTSARAIQRRAVVHFEDVMTDAQYQYKDTARIGRWRGTLGVPMFRETQVIGAIMVARTTPGRFSATQVALLQTFAYQAVIAIENVRLFTDTKEALEQQTATADILRVISSSPTDVQPVFDTIVRTGARLCEADYGFLARYDGTSMAIVAHSGATDEEIEAVLRVYPMAPTPDSLGGRTILERAVVQIPDVCSDPTYGPRMIQDAGWRTGLGVPLLREGTAIGLVGMWRRDVRPFTGKQISLLQTFAHQAVIAIENGRLFSELQEKNRALTAAHAEVTETLEQQTAMAEILEVISTSPTHLQPVLDAVVKSAARFCAAPDASIFRLDGEHLRADAHHGSVFLPRGFLVPAVRGTVAGRSVLERQAVSVTDLQAETEEFPDGSSLARQTGHRATLSAPLLREGAPIGVILLRRAEAVPFTGKQIALVKTFADQAVIAIENVRLFTELQNTNHALIAAHAQVTEALEQQTATSEILRVISSSPTDVQPVFDVIVERAVRLCGARFGRVYRYDGSLLHMVAGYGLGAVGLDVVQQVFPRPASDETIVGRVILTREPALMRDIEREEGVPALSRRMIEALETRSQVTIPMLRAGAAIGAMTLGWAEPEAFDEQQIALLKTFADQAVIAIENVRLFKELESKNRDLTETLQQQTTTGEILSVIASSPTDIQPVFAAVAASANRLCDALDATIFQIDGERLRVAVHNGPIASHPVGDGPSLTRDTPSGRAVLDRRTIHVADTQAEIDEYPEGSRHARRLGFRTVLAVPLVREGAAIGVINLRRTEARLFTDPQVVLLKTFADQAVIAIENVRLFKELEARNRDLTTALDQQTATSDILRVISQSQTDLQPVFDAILASAVRLLGAHTGALTRIAGDQIELAALTSTDAAGDASLRALFPQPVYSEAPHGRVIRDRAPLDIADAQTDSRVPEAVRASARSRGYRSWVTVPLLHHDEAVGTIAVTRQDPGGFTDDELALLETFADQAVIAIENVRLFSELQARTGELTRSVEKLTALGEVSQSVSSTLDVETVLQTIVSRASQLGGADGCAIYEYDDATEVFRIRATHNLDPLLVQALRASPLRKGEGAMGRAAETREPMQIADIAVAGAYQSHIRDTLLGAGYRALLSVPLLREGEIIGSLSLNRHTPGVFPPEAVEVLKTFATQSALAIQNARLFREIADKSAQLEAASRHKSEFLANMSHELRTPLNAIIGFSEVLAQGMFGAINEKQTEYLKDILESGRHLLSLINDILDLSKIEAGRMELERADFDLPSAIENALVLLRERAIRRGIRLGSKIDKRLGMISGDERKVKQVLLNLLSNALKFTPEGGQIDVAARQHDDLAEVSVADTGIGIAPTDQDTVFEEFRQVGTADKKAEGTGLGLTLSRKFIELHGGKIWVQSELGRGSTFTFTLPVS